MLFFANLKDTVGNSSTTHSIHQFETMYLVKESFMKHFTYPKDSAHIFLAGSQQQSCQN